MDKYASGLTVYDSFTGDIKEFFEFGSHVMLKCRNDDKPHEVILLGADNCLYDKGVSVPTNTEIIRYLDVNEPEFDEYRRYKSVNDRTRHIMANMIESIEDIRKYSAEYDGEEELDF